MERIEVFTGEQRRRRYTPQEKAKFVAMSMLPGYLVSLVARQNGINPSLLIKWKRLMQDGGIRRNKVVFFLINVPYRD